jgi:hypothetical protein
MSVANLHDSQEPLPEPQAGVQIASARHDVWGLSGTYLTGER